MIPSTTSNEAIKALMSSVQQQTLPATPKMPTPPLPAAAPSAPKINPVPGAKPINMAPKHALTQQVGAGKKMMPVPNRVASRSIKLGGYKHLASVLSRLDVEPITIKQAAACSLLKLLGRQG